MPEGHSAAQLVGVGSVAILFSYSAGKFTAMSMSVRACTCVCAGAWTGKEAWDGLDRGPSQVDPIPALETKASSSFNSIVRFHLLSTYYVPRNDSGILNLVTMTESESENVIHFQHLATPWTPAHQAPLSMGFSRQEYQSGLPFPSPDPGIEPWALALQADSLPSESPGKPVTMATWLYYLNLL